MPWTPQQTPAWRGRAYLGKRLSYRGSLIGVNKLGLSCAKLRANLNLSFFLVWLDMFWFGMFRWFGWMYLFWFGLFEVVFIFEDVFIFEVVFIFRLSSYLMSSLHLRSSSYLRSPSSLRFSSCLRSSSYLPLCSFLSLLSNFCFCRYGFV